MTLLSSILVVLKFLKLFLFLFSNKMYSNVAGIHKMLVREGPDQTKQSDMGLHCMSWPFWQATSVQNVRTSTIYTIKYFVF